MRFQLVLLFAAYVAAMPALLSAPSFSSSNQLVAREPEDAIRPGTNNVEVTNEEIQAAIEKMVAEFPEEKKEQVREELNKPEVIEALKQKLEHEKVEGA